MSNGIFDFNDSEVYTKVIRSGLNGVYYCGTLVSSSFSWCLNLFKKPEVLNNVVDDSIEIPNIEIQEVKKTMMNLFNDVLEGNVKNLIVLDLCNMSSHLKGQKIDVETSKFLKCFKIKINKNGCFL